MRNKLITSLSVFLLMLSFLMPYADATTYASDQIDFGWVVAQKSSSGKIAVEFEVNGTGRMSKIGASYIVLYEKYSNSWREAETVTSSDYPSMYTTQAFSHCDTVYFNYVPGRQYYAVVTVFASNAQGTDYRTYTSNII